ncbi:unnamed protein product, partial [Prunus brigantina]
DDCNCGRSRDAAKVMGRGVNGGERWLHRCRGVVETWIHRGLRHHGDLASRTLASNHGYLEAFETIAKKGYRVFFMGRTGWPEPFVVALCHVGEMRVVRPATRDVVG